jgi:hypothetical protein
MADGRPALELDQLGPTYTGIFFATVALKERIAKLGPEVRPAVEELNRYQAMIKTFMEAFEETRKMHARGGDDGRGGERPLSGDDQGGERWQ